MCATFAKWLFYSVSVKLYRLPMYMYVFTCLIETIQGTAVHFIHIRSIHFSQFLEQITLNSFFFKNNNFPFFSSLNHPHSLWISKVILCLFSIFVTSILWTSSRTSLLMLTHLIINFQVLHVQNKKPGRYTLGFASVVHSKD